MRGPGTGPPAASFCRGTAGRNRQCRSPDWRSFIRPEHLEEDGDVGAFDAAMILGLILLEEPGELAQIVKRHRKLRVMPLVIAETVRGEQVTLDGPGRDELYLFAPYGFSYH